MDKNERPTGRKKWTAKRYVGLVLAAVLLYLAIGACAPFMLMKQVSPETQSTIDALNVYGDDVGVDRAAVIETNKEALDIRLRMIDDAQEEIILSTFDIRAGESTKDIFAAFLAAADRGVHIRIIVDGVSTTLRMHGGIFEALGSHENVEIYSYNPVNPLLPWSLNGRMHDKYLIIDDALLLAGGRNMFDYFIGEYGDAVGTDREVLVYNTAAGTSAGDESVIKSVKDYFDEMCDLSICKRILEKETKNGKAASEELAKRYLTLSGQHEQLSYEEITVATNKITFLVNPTTRFGKEPVVFASMQKIMAEAKERVWIHTPYAVLSSDMKAGLKLVATQVPETLMLLNSRAVGDNVMASSDYTMNRGQVLKTDFTLFEYFGDHSMHGKSILVDEDISIIGSYNFDMRSTYVDTETMFVIHSKALNAQLEEKMSTLKENALELTADGEYIASETVAEKELSAGKSIFYGIMSVLVQLFRYLL